jgi:hypothetical protein
VDISTWYFVDVRDYKSSEPARYEEAYSTRVREHKFETYLSFEAVNNNLLREASSRQLHGQNVLNISIGRSLRRADCRRPRPSIADTAANAGPMAATGTPSGIHKADFSKTFAESPPSQEDPIAAR